MTVARVYGPNAEGWKRKVAKMTDALYDKARPDKVVTINITAINLYQLN